MYFTILHGPKVKSFLKSPETKTTRNYFRKLLAQQGIAGLAVRESFPEREQGCAFQDEIARLGGEGEAIE